jgi:vacuolar-type H+-ATPase subunit I/STV1
MSFAICLNVVNHLHFNKKMFIWLEFVPQILFMESIFGYLVFCIMYKWSVDWYARGADGELLHGQPPNLLNMLIYMFLSPGTIIPGEQLYPGQVKKTQKANREWLDTHTLLCPGRCASVLGPYCCHLCSLDVVWQALLS